MEATLNSDQLTAVKVVMEEIENADTENLILDDPCKIGKTYVPVQLSLVAIQAEEVLLFHNQYGF